MKQFGAVLAKGWILGLQFYTLLHDGTYFAITKRADEYAMQIRDAFRQKGIEELVVSPTNQQFVILSQEQARKLGDKNTSLKPKAPSTTTTSASASAPRGARNKKK